MAIYHLSAQVISRSAGRSSVAAAAYRAGERLEDERTGLVHDYGRRRDIVGWVQAPEQAPEWVYDRQALWSRVETRECRYDAQLAREINVALPVELDREQQQEVLWDYVKEQFVERGMVADVALHHGDPDNPHAHIMLTMREVGSEGFGPKVRDWNDRALLGEWRTGWAEHTNAALERAGHDERIDHRSLADQGLDRLPTVHEGPTVREMEARGIATERGDWNRAVAEHTRLGPALAEAGRQLAEAKEAAARDAWIAHRVADWERDGYGPTAARALAGVEHDDHDRQPYRTLAEVRGAIDCRRATLDRERRALERERQALGAARAARREHEEAQVAAAAHAGRGAALRRLLSAQARDDYARAAARLAAAVRELTRTGGGDPTELARRADDLAVRQRAHTQDRAAFAPLQAARDEITRVEHAHQRAEREQRLEQERNHDREESSGRERTTKRERSRDRDDDWTP